jgi:PKD repeat protein
VSFDTPNAVYTWDFGDGTVVINNDPSFTHTFAAPGNYDICLSVVDGLCANQFCQTWQVGDPAFICDAWFAYQANGFDLTVFEQSQVQDSVIAYDWTFGDGGTATGAQATHSYAQDGMYEVCLTTTTTFCTETQCQYIFLSNPGNCHPSFWAYPDSIHSLNMYFSNWTLGSPLATYTWDFGDGTVANNAQPNFFHTYAAPGNYDICLTVEDGNCTAQFCQHFQVGDPAFICSAWFSTHHNGLAVDFLEYTQVVDSVVVFEWDFGDGTVDTGSAPTHTYAAAGLYDVCLKVTTTFCSTQYCATIHVDGGIFNGNCQAYYWAWPDAGNPLSIVFSNQSTASPNAIYQWDFGDGTIVANNAPSLVYTYASPGLYNICLTVIDGNCSNTFCSLLHVQNGGGGAPTCTAGFSFYEDGYHVYLMSDLQDPNFLYQWDILPGGNAMSGPNTAFSPGAPGLYWVCLTVTAPDGSCQDYFCQSIEVQHVQPACQAGVLVVPDPNAAQNFIITFTNTSMGGDANTVYFLTVDGQDIFFNGPSITLAFPAAGIYSVCISMQGDSCTDTQCFPLQVGAQAFNCQASFFFDLDSLALDPFNLVAVHNSIFDPGTQFLWEFGDGHISPDPYPTHTYADFGTYTICLTMSNPLTGCFDTHCDTIGVDSLGNFWRNGQQGFTINIQQAVATSVEAAADASAEAMRLFPNPTTGHLYLDLAIESGQEVWLSVVSVTGQVVQQRPVQLAAGEQRVSLDVSELPAGVYSLQIQGLEKNISKLLVKH